MALSSENSRPIPANEVERLKVLADFDPDYTDLQSNFENLTALAAKISGSHISLVNLIDSFTQWSVSNYGLDIDQMPREESICQYTIAGDEHLEISDLSIDERSKDFFYVGSPLNLRHYFGVPLKTPGGYNIGALCVMDETAKTLTPDKIELLKLLAKEVVDKLINLKITQNLKNELDESKKSQRKAAHDIRGPLSGVTGIIDIIRKRDVQNQISDVLDYMKMIENSTKGVLTLTEEILNEEKVLKSDDFNVITFKDRLDKLYTPQAKAKNIFFKVIVGAANHNVNFSKYKLLTIAGNLISNAIKFSSDYGTVTVKLDLSVVDKEKTLKIDVSDNGNGLSQESVDKILNGQLESSDGTSGERGYGLGLPMVTENVKSLNGTMEITSQEGWGTNFEITIPLS
ncbi:GAF domain-containing sensor histidine kinase [Pedobacter jejuensis]|uniref:histidine kinase n=1 Tax=Pedobacter jejuensis TaxID=1268550 RepID=A0A3N0BQ85_9SPHI|nr:GAF domain-containing sensor histidine kinase [Pedobacter jejuensis]RNL51153.1 sensor histidine kinase [Pedobacter jejuensis]